jgi:hypothetical protein
MVTSAPEALALHENVVKEVWRTAIKGREAAAYLRDLVNNSQDHLLKPIRKRAPTDARR